MIQLVGRLGFMADGQKYAKGCVLYLNYFTKSGSILRGGSWVNLGWGFWIRKKHKENNLELVK